jgi:hypothetical protein
MIGCDDVRELGILPREGYPPLPVLGRLDTADRRGHGTLGNRAERLLDLGEEVRTVKIPNDNHHGIVRGIVGFVKGEEIRTAEPPEVIHPANNRIAVRMGLEGGRLDLFP